MSRLDAGPAGAIMDASHSWSSLSAVLERRAAPGVLSYTLVVFAVTVFLHPTPLYFVETDLLGEYIPAARALAAGSLAPAHLSYHGPGYPLLLAGLVPLCRGASGTSPRTWPGQRSPSASGSRRARS